MGAPGGEGGWQARPSGGGLARLSRALGMGPRPDMPQSWGGIGMVRFEAERGTTRLDFWSAQGSLAVAGMVRAEPSSIAPDMAAAVDRLVAKVEAAYNRAWSGLAHVPVADDDVPPFEFLREQARIRASVPLRMLRTCRTCRAQDVVNPDYQKVRRSMERELSWVDLGAAVFEPISFFAHLAGRTLGRKKPDLDLACKHCQGFETDDRVITFCPGCGQRRTEAVLTTCPDCGHDFRAALPDEPHWLDPPVRPAPWPVPPPEPAFWPPQLGPAPPPPG